MKKISILIFTAMTASAATSYAQNFDTSKFQLGIEFGSLSPSNPSNVAQSLVNRVGGVAISSQDTSASFGRLFGDFNLSENLGVELGYLNSGNLNATFTGISGGGVAYSGTVTDSVSGLDYSVFVRPSKSTGFNGAFFKFGGTSYTLNESASVASGYGSAAGSTNYSGSGTFWAVGYDFQDNSKNSWRLAYSNNTKIGGQDANASTFSIGYIIGF